MTIDRRLKNTCAVGVLALGALLATTAGAAELAGAPPEVHATCRIGAARCGRPPIPPLLAPLSPRALRQLREQEAFEAAEDAYRLPAGARYSLAELNAYTYDSRHPHIWERR